MNKNTSTELLNQGVADELQAVHQYMYWHFHLDDQGFRPLALLLKRIAIKEMGHVEKLAERILFLKGDVEMVPAGAVEKIIDAQMAFLYSSLHCCSSFGSWGCHKLRPPPVFRRKR